MAGRVVPQIFLILQLIRMLEITMSVKMSQKREAFQMELNHRIIAES